MNASVEAWGGGEVAIQVMKCNEPLRVGQLHVAQELHQMGADSLLRSKGQAGRHLSHRDVTLFRWTFLS